LNTEIYFYFSLGPVQEFVGRARKLRDYWTGSNLISFLIEQAIDEICSNGGNIVFPPFSGNKNPSNKKEISSFPNRFLAIVPEDFKLDCCEKRIKNEWEKIADYQWEAYISKIAPFGENTKLIWDKQVKDYWDIQWIASDEENDALLDIRKNWRSFVPTVEQGDKCTIIGNLQEISGYVGTSSGEEKKKQKRFWERAQDELSQLNLSQGERLSAIAVIKRLFPRAYNEINKTSFPVNFPSSTYVSSVFWKEAVIKSNRDFAIEFLNEAKKIKDINYYTSREKSDFCCLDKLTGNGVELREFASLDGNICYEHTLLNDNLWKDQNRLARENLEKKLKEINDEIKFKPDTYYALLSMDGDKMGEILYNFKSKKNEISNAILEFNKNVPNIIKKNNGRVIYAGGEDVFAILPVDTAIDAASELRKTYEGLLEQVIGSKGVGTISAAIIFAHHHAPLNRLYGNVQSLLDKKAKEECGRGSIAISVWNTGGKDLIWAMPWEKFIDNENNNLIGKLAKALSGTGTTDQISSSFIYNMRKTFQILELEKGNTFLEKEEIVDFLVAEFIKGKSKTSKKINRDQVKLQMEDLLEVSTVYYRNDEREIQERQTYNLDGALLARFLARRWHQ
jgi:CRISPR-associated protein Cmr2